MIKKTIVFSTALMALFFFVHYLSLKKTPTLALKVMTYNIGNSGCPHKLSRTKMINMIMTIIKKEGPDIVMLQEAGYLKGRLPEAIGYHSIFFKKEHVALLSRMPLKKVGEHYLDNKSGKDGEAICASTEWNGKGLLVCSAYLTSIPVAYKGKVVISKAKMLGIALRETLFDTQRVHEAEDLIQWISGLGYKNVVIGGDFNSLFFFKSMRHMREKFSDTAWGTPAFWSTSYKWPQSFLPFKIDYIYVTKNMEYGGTKIIRQSPGDHYPVVTYVR